jgi:hypothetical protein
MNAGFGCNEVSVACQHVATGGNGLRKKNRER